MLFAILQKYDFSSKSQQQKEYNEDCTVVCDTAKVRFFKQITTPKKLLKLLKRLFAILQKYDFSSKSQHLCCRPIHKASCLRYCKSTIFQANHNCSDGMVLLTPVVCDTAKVRFFKQITTSYPPGCLIILLFAILQKYDFSSKSQRTIGVAWIWFGCLRYCKSTIFQANHNCW